MGRKGPRAKTKTVLKSVSKWEQFGSMPNFKFQTLLNKNPPIALPSPRSHYAMLQSEPKSCSASAFPYFEADAELVIIFLRRS